MHLFIAIGCAVGTVLHLKDMDDDMKDKLPYAWKGLCWANAVMVGFLGIAAAYLAGR